MINGGDFRMIIDNQGAAGWREPAAADARDDQLQSRTEHEQIFLWAVDRASSGIAADPRWGVSREAGCPILVPNWRDSAGIAR